MNPILYAFLSDNFKKSFLKACTCAAGKDFNAQLQMENSFFPRFGKRSSEKFASTTRAGALTGVTTTINNTNTPIADTTTQPTQLQSTNAFNSVVINDEELIDCIDDIMPNIIKSNSLNTKSSSSCKSDNLSYYSLNERPPVLHTDL